MDSKELRNLHEAYMDVYAPQENIEEGLRSAVKRLLGGGKKEAEAPKPESRGEQLRKKYNVGPEKSDTSAKRQILDRSRAKAEKDEKDYGDKPFQKQVAQKSKAAHDSYLKAGYSKYGADLPVSGGQGGSGGSGRGSKAAKREAALNIEEFEIIVNALIEEGYDLSSYTWDEMYEVCLDEAVKGASRHDTEMRKAASTERKSGIKNRLSPAAGKDNADKMQRDVKFFDKLTKKNRNVVGLVTKEDYDIFDAILEHLIAEGYADTNESALAIMANMSEEWRQSIVEGGFNSSGRYDVGGGRTVGPVAGAVRSLFSGNLPKGQTYVPPSPQRGTNRPPAVPSSKGDSGKLTDFGAGGGKAKLKTGMSVGQVERQGRMNKGDYSG